MSEEPPKRSGLIYSLVAIAGIFLLYLPLLLSFAEHQFVGTNHVENVCRQLRIHGFLGILYGPVLRLLR